MNAALGVLCCLLLAAGCTAPTVAQRADAYQAALLGAQAACLAMLKDKEVPRTPDAEKYCVQLLTGTCEAE